MKCKKIISSVLMVALLFTLFSVFSLSASAVSATSITIPSVSAEVGQTVTVAIKMTGVFAGMKGKINYDTSKLTLTEMTQNTKELSGYAYVTKGQSFAYAKASNTTLSNVTILTLTFKCKATGVAAITMTELELYQVPASGQGSEDAAKQCKLTNGKVTVAAAKPAVVYATKITAKPTSLSLTKGKTYSLTYSLSPSNSQDSVTYSSSNKSVATVDSKTGKVTAVGPGTATITIQGKNTRATCTITVYSYVSLRVNKTRAIANTTQTTVDSQGTKPFIIGGRTMIPMRFVGEKMGGKVKYTSDSDPIVMTYGSQKVEIRLNSNKMTVYSGSDKTVVTIDVVAQKRNGRTFIPLRAISQALGFTVYYQAGTELIVVNTPKMSTSLRNERLAEAKAYITK